MSINPLSFSIAGLTALPALITDKAVHALCVLLSVQHSDAMHTLMRVVIAVMVVGVVVMGGTVRRKQMERNMFTAYIDEATEIANRIKAG